jgi:hypothetical protein
MPGKFSSSHDFSIGRSVSRTTSSSVGSCFLAVSDNLVNAEPIATVVALDSNPASGSAPVLSSEVRGSAGANVISPASSSVIARRMAAKASSIKTSSLYTGCCIQRQYHNPTNCTWWLTGALKIKRRAVDFEQTRQGSQRFQPAGWQVVVQTRAGRRRRAPRRCRPASRPLR